MIHGNILLLNVQLHVVCGTDGWRACWAYCTKSNKRSHQRLFFMPQTLNHSEFVHVLVTLCAIWKAIRKAIHENEFASLSAVTQHTTAYCSMQIIDITLAEQASTNITSLRMVQQKHCRPKYKLNFIWLQTEAWWWRNAPHKRTPQVLSVYNNWKASNN
jgi:hypothetical protein